MTTSRARWSWSQDQAEAEGFQSEAQGLVGEELAGVHYVTLDYRSEEFRGDIVGPRTIASATEWADRHWRHPACDTVDYAVELRTASGRFFTASWESPGRIEGLGLRELPAIGAAVPSGSDAAVWDVSTESGWRKLMGQRVTSVELRFEPWDETGPLWCRRIDLSVGEAPVTLLLAEGTFGSDGLAPSADSVAVLFDTAVVPPWPTTESEA